jgi:hypothetical protein
LTAENQPLRINHGEHGEHGEKPMKKPLTTEAQRYREKQEKSKDFVFDFLCVSVPLWLMVLVSPFSVLSVLSVVNPFSPFSVVQLQG